MNRILVTGGNGFLGRAVRRELIARGYRCHFTPPHSELDLLNPQQTHDFVHEEEIDTVIHCAAFVGGIKDNVAKPADMIRQNLMMGLNVLDACKNNKVQHLVIIGTSCSYPAGAQCPTPETDMFTGMPARETAYYGIAKSTLFVAADAYRKQYGLRSTLLVPSNLYGPYDTSTHVIPDLVRKFCDKNRDIVSVWGSGNQTRDFLYVDDCAKGIINACETDPLPTVPINLGSGIETSLVELVDRLKRLSGFQGKVTWDETAPVGTYRRVLDVNRAVKWINWSASTLLEDGLKETVEAFKHTHVQS